MTASFASFMLAGGWSVFALIASSFSAGFYLVNQYLRQPGDILVFWMRIVVLVILTPVIYDMELPENPLFYGLVSLTALVGTGADIRTFNVSAQYGAGVVSRVMPVTVWGSFLLWFFVDPGLLRSYAAEPVRATGIVLTLVACVYFAMRLHKCEVTKAALRAMAPALAGYVLSTVLNKMALSAGAVNGGFTGAVYAYMFVQSAIAVFMAGPLLIFKERNKRRAPAGWGAPMAILASLMAGFVWVSHMAYKNYAVAYAPHPSYQAAVNLTAPVFIMLFYKLVKHREQNVDVKSGMGIVVSALLLVLITI